MRIATRGKGGRPLPFAKTYKNPKTARYAAVVTHYAKAAMALRPLLEGALACDILCIFALPAGRHRKREPVAREWRMTKPDWDNLGKPICDAMKGVVYFEDSHIVDGRVRTIWGAQGEEPRAIITLSEPGAVPCQVSPS